MFKAIRRRFQDETGARCGCNPACSCLILETDGACLDLNVSGLGTPSNPYTITGEVKVDGTTVVCGPNGLAAQVTITALDTDSIDTTVTGGPSAFVVSGDVFLQDDGTGPLAGTPGGSVNLLKLNPGQGINGLYVSCEDIQDCVGAEIGPALAGTCLTYDDAANKINVELDADATNIVGCGTGPTGTGLYAKAAVCVPVPITTSVITGAPCLSVQGDSCAGFNIELGISSDPCNGLVCHGNGLFIFQDPTALPPRVSATSSQPAQGPFNGTSGPTNVGVPLCVSITNPSPCKSMAVAGDFYGDVRISKSAGTINVGLSAGTAPGGPFGPTSSQAGLGGATDGDATFNLYNDDFDFGVVAPGATVMTCATYFVNTNGVVNGRIVSGNINLSLRPRWND